MTLFIVLYIMFAIGVTGLLALIDEILAVVSVIFFILVPPVLAIILILVEIL